MKYYYFAFIFVLFFNFSIKEIKAEYFFAAWSWNGTSATLVESLGTYANCYEDDAYKGDIFDTSNNIGGGLDCTNPKNYATKFASRGSAQITDSLSDGDGWYWYRFQNSTDSDYHFIRWQVASGTLIQSSITRSYIKNIVQPLYDTVTSSTTVEFEFDYYSGIAVGGLGEVYQACIEYTYIQELIYNQYGCNDVYPFDGDFSYSTTTVLLSGINYQWRPIIADSDGNILDTGSWTNFAVVTVQDNSYNDIFSIGVNSTTTVDQLNLQCDPEAPLWERSVCNLGILLFVPSSEALVSYREAIDNLQSKTPFYEMEQVKNTINTLEVDSGNSIGLQFTLPSAFGGGSFTLFSSSTVTSLLGSTAWNVWYTLFGLGLYLTYFIYVFNKGKSAFTMSKL